VIKYNNPYKQAFDLLVILFAIFNSLSTPVEISFKPEYIENYPFKIANGVIDVIFLVDLVVNFRTSFISGSGEEIIQPKQITHNYILGTFWIDLMASIPLDMMMTIDNEFIKSLSVLKLFRILRLNRII